LEIFGHKVKFIKVKSKLVHFGLINYNIPYSSLEKTVLDFIYLGRYNSLSDREIRNRIIDLIALCSKNKMFKYSENYPRTTRKTLEAL